MSAPVAGGLPVRIRGGALLTAKAASLELGVSRSTFARMVRRGLFRVVPVTPGAVGLKSMRIPRADVEGYINGALVRGAADIAAALGGGQGVTA